MADGLGGSFAAGFFGGLGDKFAEERQRKQKQQENERQTFAQMMFQLAPNAHENARDTMLQEGMAAFTDPKFNVRKSYMKIHQAAARQPMGTRPFDFQTAQPEQPYQPPMAPLQGPGYTAVPLGGDNARYPNSAVPLGGGAQFGPSTAVPLGGGSISNPWYEQATRPLRTMAPIPPEPRQPMAAPIDSIFPTAEEQRAAALSQKQAELNMQGEYEAQQFGRMTDPMRKRAALLRGDETEHAIEMAPRIAQAQSQAEIAAGNRIPIADIYALHGMLAPPGSKGIMVPVAELNKAIYLKAQSDYATRLADHKHELDKLLAKSRIGMEYGPDGQMQVSPAMQAWINSYARGGDAAMRGIGIKTREAITTAAINQGVIPLTPTNTKGVQQFLTAQASLATVREKLDKYVEILNTPNTPPGVIYHAAVDFNKTRNLGSRMARQLVDSGVLTNQDQNAVMDAWTQYGKYLDSMAPLADKSGIVKTFFGSDSSATSGIYERLNSLDALFQDINHRYWGSSAEQIQAQMTGNWHPGWTKEAAAVNGLPPPPTQVSPGGVSATAGETILSTDEDWGTPE